MTLRQPGLALALLLAVQADAHAGFTQAEADAGRADYARYCADCHHGSLRGSAHGAPLAGPAFAEKWNGKPAGEPLDVLTGFVSDDGRAWGRPVGVVIDVAGALLVADDVGNVVWRVVGSADRPD
jgi:mono/diheme cytochrome c family protein